MQLNMADLVAFPRDLTPSMKASMATWMKDIDPNRFEEVRSLPFRSRSILKISAQKLDLQPKQTNNSPSFFLQPESAMFFHDMIHHGYVKWVIGRFIWFQFLQVLKEPCKKLFANVRQAFRNSEWNYVSLTFPLMIPAI